MASRRTSDSPPCASSPPENLLNDPSNAKWLRFGSLSHYAEPAYYDKCYADRRDDIAFYSRCASVFGAQDILEYGCGNGRITLPLARQGHRIHGVDLSQPMIDALDVRLRKESSEVRQRVSRVRADMRDKKLRRRFDLVLCTFNTFLHLYVREDVERFLSRVRAHLRPEGRFVFDTALPLPEELARNPAKPYRVPRLKYPPTGQIVKYAEYFDYNPMSQVLRVTMRFEPMDAPQEAWSVLLTHRQYHPCEIEALLHYNGFELESVHPDFQAADASLAAVDSIGWVARRRAKR